MEQDGGNIGTTWMKIGTKIVEKQLPRFPHSDRHLRISIPYPSCLARSIKAVLCDYSLPFPHKILLHHSWFGIIALGSASLFFFLAGYQQVSPETFSMFYPLLFSFKSSINLVFGH